MLCPTCKLPFNGPVGSKFCSLACAYWDGVIVDGGVCWIWQKRVCSKKGYGKIKFNNQEFLAHRVGFAIKYDTEVPQLWNTCGNVRCVRPEHWCNDSTWKRKNGKSAPNT